MRKMVRGVVAGAAVGMVALGGSAGVANAAGGAASSKVELTVNPAEAGRQIPPDFLGLSFETMAILKDKDGHYTYFTPQNASLARLFGSLGVKSLRIGGNTADTPTVPLPTHEDIDSLYDFAKMANVRVMYTLRMRSGDVDVATEPAQYVMGHYGALTDCLAVGNEPDVFEHHDFSKYSADMKRFLPAVMKVAPEAKICGPGSTGGDPTWAAKYAAEFGSMPQLKWVTQHAYPGKNGKKIESVESARALLLNSSIDEGYAKSADAFMPQVKVAGAKFRMEETNSFYNAGAKDVSNTFAATLWGLGYLHWWLERGADGLNFHTGLTTAAGDQQSPCWYAVFWAKPEATTILPLAYAMKAFSIAAQGKVLPVHAAAASPEVEQHGAVRDDGTIMLTLVNRSFGSGAKDDSVEIALPKGYSRAETLELRAPKGDIGAMDGVTLGGSAIGPEGEWSGEWKAAKTSNGKAAVELPAASAVMVRLTR
jgi:hypothetical protein